MTRSKPLPSLMRWLITIGACLAVTGVLAFFKVSQIRGVLAAVAAQPEFSQSVEAARPVATDFQPRVEALGVVAAPLQVTLRNELAGSIAEVKARSGAHVAKGQVILQLDISEQRASLSSARARLALAKSVLQRDLNLQKSSFVSEDKVDHSRAEVAVVEAEIDGIESVITRRTIKAPFAGVIGIHSFEPGQYLNANSEITTLVGDSEEMWVDFSLPQFYGELAPGSRIEVRVVRSDAVTTGEPLVAEVIAGDATINTAARSRRYRAAVHEGARRLLDNMSVAVVVPIGLASPLWAIPSLSVQSDTKGQFVWALDPDSGGKGYRARRLGVTTYGQQGDRTYVDGVTGKDLIAGPGAFKLSANMLVKTVGTVAETGSGAQ